MYQVATGRSTQMTLSTEHSWLSEEETKGNNRATACLHWNQGSGCAREARLGYVLFSEVSPGLFKHGPVTTLEIRLVCDLGSWVCVIPKMLKV